MDGLAHDRKGPDTHGDHGNGFADAAHALQNDAVAVFDALFLGQFVAHFHIQLGFGLQKVGHVAGFAAAAPMLRKAVGGEHNGIARVCRRGDLVHIRSMELVDRAAQLAGEGMALERGFRGLIVLGEGPVRRAHAVELSVAVLHHDEGQFALFLVGQGRPGAVGHVAHPFGAVPLDNRLLGVPGLAVGVHRGAVVENAPVDRPAPRPIGEQTDIGLHGRLAGVATFGLVAVLFRPTAAVKPVERRGGAVVLKNPKGGHLLTAFVLLFSHLAVGPELAVDALGPLGGDELVRPVHLEDGIRQGAALRLVQFADLIEQGHYHIAEVAGLVAGLHAHVEPLQPAAAVADGAFLLNTVGRGQQKDFGFAGLGVHAGALPVICGFRVMDFHADQPVQFVQSGPHLVGIGEAVHGVHAHDEAAPHLALVHLVHGVHVGAVLARLQLGQQVIAEVVFGRGRVAKPALEQADHVLGPVAPPVGAVFERGDRGVGFLVVGQALPGRTRHRQITRQDVVQQGVVCGALYVGFAAQSVDAAARHADIAQQKLDKRRGADVLHAHRVLGPAQGVEDGARLVRLARGAEGLVDLKQVFL